MKCLIALVCAFAVAMAHRGLVPPVLTKHQEAFPLPAATSFETTLASLWPDSITLGNIPMVKCMEDNPYGLGGIYCTEIPMPLNREDCGDERQINVAFAVRVAPRNLLLPPRLRKAIFFPLGGPGGLLESEGMMALALFAQFGILSRYDIVFGATRGSAHSCFLSCYGAIAAHTAFPYSGTSSATYAAGYAAAAEACLKEIGNTTVEEFQTPCIINSANADPRKQRLELLPFLNTKVFAQDYKTFHDLVGYRRVVFYGLSYGASLSQVYAGLYPLDMEALILDSGTELIEGMGVSSQQYAADFKTSLAKLAAMCAQSPACAKDGCPGVSNTNQCTNVIKNAFNAALSPTRQWPVRLTYPYINPASNQVTNVQLDLHRSLEASLAYLFMAGNRANLARALIQASRGDYMMLARIVYGAYGIDPRNPAAAPVEPYLAQGAAYLFPHVTANDNVWRWKILPLPPVSAVQRGVGFVDAIGTSTVGSVGGAGSALWEAFAPALGNGNTPIFSKLLQYTLTPVPLAHLMYPVLITCSDMDGQVPVSNSQLLYERYAENGHTGFVVVNGASHGVSAAGYFDGFIDPGYMPWIGVLQEALIHGRWLSGKQTFALEYPFPKYDPLPPSTITLSTLLPALESEIVSLPEWRMYMTQSAACTKGGSISWGNMREDGKEELVLNGCKFFAGQYAVSGTALFDWMSEDLYNIGANFEFEKVTVTTVATNAKTCYKYVHAAGQNPVITAVSCA